MSSFPSTIFYNRTFVYVVLISDNMYVGCYGDNIFNRAMKEFAIYSIKDLTPEKCHEICWIRGKFQMTLSAFLILINDRTSEKKSISNNFARGSTCIR